MNIWSVGIDMMQIHLVLVVYTYIKLVYAQISNISIMRELGKKLQIFTSFVNDALGQLKIWLVGCMLVHIL